MRIKPIPIIAIAICGVFAVRQVMWEFRPQVVPNTTKIIADLHNNIGVFVNRDSVYPHQFKDTVSESPYLFSITDLDSGDTPALVFDSAGNIRIASTLSDLSIPQKRESFQILGHAAAAFVNGRECHDFDEWLSDGLDKEFMEIHRDAEFCAIVKKTNHSIQVSILHY